MIKYLIQLRPKIFHGEYDEPLEKLFNVTLALAVLVFTAVFLILYQLGYLEYYSAVLKPVQGIEWTVLPI
jgi:hypothetical protein